MKTQFIYFIFLICVLNYFGLAQNPKINEKYKIDSLKKVLTLTTSKADQIPLRFQIGKHLNIRSHAYWDSLLNDTRLYKLPLYECKVLDELSHIYRNTSREKGLEYIKKSVALAEKNRYKTEQLILIKDLLFYYRTGNYGKITLDWGYKGLKIAEELKDKRATVDFYSIIATHYFFVGDIQKALKIHFNCLEIYRSLHDTIDIAGSLTDIGADYRLLGDTMKMCDYYLEAGTYAPHIRDPFYAAYIYNSLASAYYQLKQADSCYKYSNLAYNLYKKLDDKQGIASSLQCLGTSLLLKNELKGAEKIFLEAYELAKTNDFTAQLPDAALALKTVYIKEKNYKKALEASDLYIAVKDSISNEKNRKQALEKEFSYAFEKKESENKLLAKEIRIQALEIGNNKYILVGMTSLILLMLVIAYLFFRQNKLKNEQQNIQLEQKLLRSQMNPHFIFNSLQAIQSIVLKEDKKKAERYLGFFARVMRNVLENSRVEAISLQKEIHLLDDYLQLQQLRFDHRFEYSIKTGDTIDLENTFIPPMLAQPFIENAIEHGLHGIKSGGVISVKYSPKKNGLVVEITDNGIGMKDYGSNKEHRSLAIEVTRERIALMNKKTKKKAFFNIGEAFPANEERKGVKVIFILPQMS